MASDSAVALATQQSIKAYADTKLDVATYDPQSKAADAFLASNHDFLQAGTGAAERTVQSKLRETISITDFGAAIDGTTDDTSAVQAAIDHAASLHSGGDVLVPRGSGACMVSNLTLKPLVRLIGSPGLGISQPTPSSLPRLAAIAGTTGYLIDTPATAEANIGVIGLRLNGLGSGTSLGGVRFQDVDAGNIIACNFNNFADHAIRIDGGTQVVLRYNYALNCLLDRTRAQKTGVIHIAGGTDHVIEHGEITPSLSTLSDANAYICALVMAAGTNTWVFGGNYQTADVGIHIADGADELRMVAVKTAGNNAHGWEVDGHRSQFVGCLSWRDGQETNNTYDAFVVAGDDNIFSGCRGLNFSGDSEKHRYSFNNSGTGNTFPGCRGLNPGTATFNGTIEAPFDGRIAAGNLLRQGTRSDAGTALSLDDSGGDFVTGGALTILNTPGFHCDLEIGADTHDFTHNSITLDISAAGFVAGETYTVRVRESNAIRVIGPAGQFTEADFA